MGPSLFQTERNCAELAIYEHCSLSPVPRIERIGPSTRQFAAFSELYVNPTNCVADEAVWIEPFSASNSLKNRERTGNSCDFERDPSRHRPEKPWIRLGFLGKFPTQLNRELFFGNRDLFPRIREFTGWIREISNSPHTVI